MIFTGYFDKLVISKLFGSDNDYIISPKFNEFSFQEVLQSETHTVYMSEMALYLWIVTKKDKFQVLRLCQLWIIVEAGLQDTGIHYNILSLIKTYKEELAIVPTVKTSFFYPRKILKHLLFLLFSCLMQTMVAIHYTSGNMLVSFGTSFLPTAHMLF